MKHVLDRRFQPKPSCHYWEVGQFDDFCMILVKGGSREKMLEKKYPLKKMLVTRVTVFFCLITLLVDPDQLIFTFTTIFHPTQPLVGCVDPNF